MWFLVTNKRYRNHIKNVSISSLNIFFLNKMVNLQHSCNTTFFPSSEEKPTFFTILREES
jgi:hypothetical protein